MNILSRLNQPVGPQAQENVGFEGGLSDVTFDLGPQLVRTTAAAETSHQPSYLFLTTYLSRRDRPRSAWTRCGTSAPTSHSCPLACSYRRQRPSLLGRSGPPSPLPPPYPHSCITWVRYLFLMTYDFFREEHLVYALAALSLLSRAHCRRPALPQACTIPHCPPSET